MGSPGLAKTTNLPREGVKIPEAAGAMRLSRTSTSSRRQKPGSPLRRFFLREARPITSNMDFSQDRLMVSVLDLDQLWQEIREGYDTILPINRKEYITPFPHFHKTFLISESVVAFGQ